MTSLIPVIMIDIRAADCEEIADTIHGDLMVILTYLGDVTYVAQPALYQFNFQTIPPTVPSSTNWNHTHSN